MKASSGPRRSRQTVLRVRDGRAGHGRSPAATALLGCRLRSSPPSPRRRSRSPARRPGSNRVDGRLGGLGVRDGLRRLGRRRCRRRSAAGSPAARTRSHRRRLGRRAVDVAQDRVDDHRRWRLGVLLSAIHPDPAGDLLAAAIGAGLRAAGTFPQLERDVGAVDPDRRRGHEAPCAGQFLGGHVHLVDLDLDPGGRAARPPPRSARRRGCGRFRGTACRSSGRGTGSRSARSARSPSWGLGRRDRLGGHLGGPSGRATLPPQGRDNASKDASRCRDRTGATRDMSGRGHRFVRVCVLFVPAPSTR